MNKQRNQNTQNQKLKLSCLNVANLTFLLKTTKFPKKKVEHVALGKVKQNVWGISISHWINKSTFFHFQTIFELCKQSILHCYVLELSPFSFQKETFRRKWHRNVFLKPFRWSFSRDWSRWFVNSFTLKIKGIFIKEKVMAHQHLLRRENSHRENVIYSLLHGHSKAS